MKKIVLFLSIVLAVSMIFTSVFAATTDFKPSVKLNGVPAVTEDTHTSEVLLDSIPASGNSVTANGVTFSAVAANANSTAALSIVNSDGAITIQQDAAATNVAARFQLNYSANSTTHTGVVYMEFKVKYGSALPSSLSFYARNPAADWPFGGAIAAGGALNTEYTFGITYDTQTGAYVITRDTTEVLRNTVAADKVSTGFTYSYFEWKPRSVGSSITITGIKVINYPKVAPYKTMLFSGLPATGIETTNENGVNFMASGGSPTNNNGEIVLTNPNKAVLLLSYPVSSDGMPYGDKIYYEYTVSFSKGPDLVQFIGYPIGSASASLAGTVLQKSQWKVLNGTETPAANVSGSGNSTASVNTKTQVGLLYDIKTGSYETYVNGTQSGYGTVDPSNGIQRLDLRLTVTGTFTLHDAKMIYVEDYELPTNTYLSGVDYASRKTWSQGKGVTFDAVHVGLARINNYTGRIVAKNADGYELQNSYIRLYYKFDNKPTTSTHSDNLYFEFTGNFSAVPAKISIGARNSGVAVLANILDPEVFSDGTRDYTVALVYNVTTGEWYTLVDGEPTNIKGKVSDATAAAGISDFYFEWHPADKADALTVTDVKAGYVPDTDSVGTITIDGEEASLSLHKMPAYSSINDDVTFIVASYNNDNELIAIEPTTCNLTAGDNTIKANVALADGATTVKVFVWDGLNRFATPLAASVSR